MRQGDRRLEFGRGGRCAVQGLATTFSTTMDDPSGALLDESAFVDEATFEAVGAGVDGTVGNGEHRGRRCETELSFGKGAITSELCMIQYCDLATAVDLSVGPQKILGYASFVVLWLSQAEGEKQSQGGL